MIVQSDTKCKYYAVWYWSIQIIVFSSLLVDEFYNSDGTINMKLCDECENRNNSDKLKEYLEGT